MRELALHFLDLVRNSIEAEASLVELEITEDTDADRLSFRVADNGRGMDEAVAQVATDPFFTTRTTRRVGMGLALLRATCERCDGSLRLASAPGQGTVVEGDLRFSHLDRPPLGNMGAVIQCLACEADRVDVIYRHRVAGQVLVVDTREVHCPLGIGRLTDPRVLCWLAEHVNKSLKALRPSQAAPRD